MTVTPLSLWDFRSGKRPTNKVHWFRRPGTNGAALSPKVRRIEYQSTRTLSFGFFGVWGGGKVLLISSLYANSPPLQMCRYILSRLHTLTKSVLCLIGCLRILCVGVPECRSDATPGASPGLVGVGVGVLLLAVAPGAPAWRPSLSRPPWFFD